MGILKWPRSQLMYIFMQQVNAKDRDEWVLLFLRKPGDVLSNSFSFCYWYVGVSEIGGWAPQMAVENHPLNFGAKLFSDKPMWEELVCSLDVPKNSRSKTFDRLGSAGQLYQLQVLKLHKPHFRQKAQVPCCTWKDLITRIAA